MRLFAINLLVAILIFSCSTAQKKESNDDKNLKLLQESIESRDEAFVKGKKELENGNAEVALELLSKSSYSQALFYIGYIQMQTGKTDEAASTFENCIKKDILKAESHYNLGLIYFETQNSPKAVTQMELALKAEPKHAGTLYFLGNISYMNSEMDKALNFYKKALKTNPGSKDLWNAVLAVLLSKQDFEKAWTIRENVDLANIDNIKNLLIVAEQIGKYAEGIDFIPKNLKSDLGIKELVRTLKVRNGKFGEALQSAKEDLSETKPFVVIDRYKKGKGSHAIILKKDGIAVICSSNPQKPLELKYENGKVTVTDPEKSADESKVSEMLSEICGGMVE